MEAEKSILEIYEIVLSKFVQSYRYLYICNCANDCLTPTDKSRFLEHFYTQRPSETQYVEFFNEISYRKTKCNNASWFEYDYFLYSMKLRGSKQFKLRIKLLEAIIKNLKKDEKKVGRLKK